MIFNEFPREVGPPRKVVLNRKGYLDFINIHNGKKKAVYSSVYSFANVISKVGEKKYKPNYDSAVVDKIYFDFDDKSCNAYEECNNLHKECLKQNLKHVVVMSGRGYHCYIFLKKNKLNYPKEAIKEAQNYFINKLNLTVDPQVIGNVAQMARIPNTYNPKAKRFCIPLTKGQFEKGDYIIKINAKKQNFVDNIYIGEKLFDISKFDNKPTNGFDALRLNSESLLPRQCSSENGGVKVETPPCIQYLLNKETKGWKDRYLIILYYKEKGLMINDIYKILEEHLSEKKLYHCVKEERQLQYLFGRDDLCFPSCDIMEQEDRCPGKCKFKDKLYK